MEPKMIMNITTYNLKKSLTNRVEIIISDTGKKKKKSYVTVP